MKRTPYLILLLFTPPPPQGHCVLMAPDPLTGHCGVVSALLVLMLLFWVCSDCVIGGAEGVDARSRLCRVLNIREAAVCGEEK